MTKSYVVRANQWRRTIAIGRGRSYRTFTSLPKARQWAADRGRAIRVVFA